MTDFKNSILMGVNTMTEFDNVILVGDNLQGRFDGDVQVGNTLQGEPISEAMREFIYNHPLPFKQFVEEKLVRERLEITSKAFMEIFDDFEKNLTL